MEGFLNVIGELHLPVLILTALIILYSDHQGFEYFRGKKQTLSRTFIVRSHVLIWVGLVAMIATGAALLAPRWVFMLQEPAFYVKMALVGVLVVNAVAIGKLSKVASERPFTLLTNEERRTLLLSGSLSAVGWVGSAVIGFFFL